MHIPSRCTICLYNIGILCVVMRVCVYLYLAYLTNKLYFVIFKPFRKNKPLICINGTVRIRSERHNAPLIWLLAHNRQVSLTGLFYVDHQNGIVSRERPLVCFWYILCHLYFLYIYIVNTRHGLYVYFFCTMKLLHKKKKLKLNTGLLWPEREQ